MATGTSIAGQLGIGEESTYGTGVTPTRFLEFLSHQPRKSVNRTPSKGLRAGAGIVLPKGQSITSIEAGGSTEMELQSKGMGLLWKHLLGSVATTQPSSGTDPTVYDHTFTPAGLSGKSLTIEGAWVDDGSTSHKMTMLGAKAASWTLEANADALATLKVDWNAQDVSTGDTKTSASYASSIGYFGSSLVTITLGGSTINCDKASVSFDNKLDVRKLLGNSGLQGTPVTLEKLGINAEVSADWTAWTDLARMASNTDASLVILLEGATISNAYKFTTKLTLNVQTDGDFPSLDGGRVIQPLKFTATGATAGEALTVLYRTTDTTP